MRILILLLSFGNLFCNSHPPSSSVINEMDTGGTGKKMAVPNDTMEIKNNTEFNIELRASLGTGNQWMLEDSLDKNYLTLVRSTTINDSTEMAAEPDLQIFVFKALQAGSSTISFVYKRPWKKTADAKAERKKYFIAITE